MFSLSQQRYDITTKGTGLEAKEHSTHHANHDVFNKLAQRANDPSVEEGMTEGLYRLNVANAVCRYFQAGRTKSIVYPENPSNRQPGE